MIACRMRIAGRIPKVTDKHSDYVILFPFPLKQWLQERASVLRYTPALTVWLPQFTFSHLHGFLFFHML
jgi:hypothetical protein